MRRDFAALRVFSGFAQKVVTRKLTRQVAILGREPRKPRKRPMFHGSARMFHEKKVPRRHSNRARNADKTGAAVWKVVALHDVMTGAGRLASAGHVGLRGECGSPAAALPDDTSRRRTESTCCKG